MQKDKGMKETRQDKGSEVQRYYIKEEEIWQEM